MNDEPELLTALTQLGYLRPEQLGQLPKFLIISPPKTGSSWLAANLAAHSAVSLPPEKEARFFSSGWKWSDLNWYLSRFPNEPGRVLRGEASPTYAILPVRTIELLRKLVPDLKLIFLMRDPVQRAWSHAKHCWRYREANLVDCQLPFEAVPEGAWFDNFTHDWTTTSGDYLGQLRRWLSVFPKEQMFVGFYEQIQTDPRALLHRVFTFLGINEFDLDKLRCNERVHAGVQNELPAQHAERLRQLWQPSMRELVQALREKFNLEVPESWDCTLQPAVEPTEEPSQVLPRIRAHEFDDEFLTQTMAWEENSPLPRLVQDSFLGYRLYLYRRRLFALAHHVSPDSLQQMEAAELAELQDRGECLWGATVAILRERIEEFLQREMQRARRAEADLAFRISRIEPVARQIECERDELREQVQGLTRQLGEAIDARDRALELEPQIEQHRAEISGLKQSRWYRIAVKYRRARHWMKTRATAMFGF